MYDKADQNRPKKWSPSWKWMFFICKYWSTLRLLGCFVSSFDEIGQELLWEHFFKFCYFDISLLSPFVKDHCSSIEQTGFPINQLTKDNLCQVWWNWPSSFSEEDENVTSLHTDGRTDVRRSKKLRWAKSNNSKDICTNIMHQLGYL